jgi:hypothetical protein
MGRLTHSASQIVPVLSALVTAAAREETLNLPKMFST